MRFLKRHRGFFLWGVLWVLLGPLWGTAADFRPFQEGERLTYRLLWPSRVVLGEAVFQVSTRGKELNFQVTVEGRLPQYRLSHSIAAIATLDDLCSLQFHQKSEEGTRRSEDSLQFDQAAHQARRIRGGQTTTATIPECARDPLTLVYYVRSQLASGKPPESGATHWGRNIAVRLERAGSETLQLGGKSRPAEKFQVSYFTPTAERKFAVWFSTDAARTPLRFTVPTTLAEFTAELE